MPEDRSLPRSAWVGLAVWVLLVAVAALVPPLTGWRVNAQAGNAGVPPLSASWDLRVGVGTLPALVLAYVGGTHALRLASSLSWRRLLWLSYAAGLAWLLSLALVDGAAGLAHEMDHRIEYLWTARQVHDVPAMLHGFTARIPGDSPDPWQTHVAGHPPLALLFFVALVRVGLGSGLAAGLVVAVVAASTAPGVLVTLHRLGAERVARRVAPFLALGPAALWMGVSADAVFTAVSVWGLACLAYAATSRGAPVLGWGLVAGVLLGSCVLMSYGLPLLGLPALAVLAVARSWRPLPVAAAGALAVVLGFAAAGFRLWEAYPLLRTRYLVGIARERPFAYWSWGDLAALGLSAGPVLGAGLGRLVALGRGADRTVRWLVAGAAAAVVVADLTAMSKAETERIWLPFVPWLLLSVTLLPERWRCRGLWLQVAVALVLQHVLDTTW